MPCNFALKYEFSTITERIFVSQGEGELRSWVGRSSQPPPTTTISHSNCDCYASS